MGSRPDRTMSEDRRVLVSLAHDLEFDGDVLSTVREVIATMHDGSVLGPREQVLSSVPARSVRRLVFVRNSEDVHSTVPVMVLTMLDSESDRGSQNSAPSSHVPVGNDEAPISEVGSVLGPDAITGESDTESLPGSVVDAEVEVEEEPLGAFPVHGRAIRAAFQDLDECNLVILFERRAHTMKLVPYFFRGGYRAAVRLALEEIVSGWDDAVKQERGWKLFIFFPRMLLSRLCRGGLVSRRKLETRFQKFFAGDWAGLVADSEDLTSQASTARVRKSRRHHPDVKAARAEKLAMMGELSAAHQALESAGVAPGDRNTLNIHRNPARRPAAPREPADLELMFEVDHDVFCVILRSAKRGAPGPSGLFANICNLLLEMRNCCAKSPPSWREVISLPQL